MCEKFQIEETSENFETWVNKPYINEKLKNQLKKANVLIIPKEGFRDKEFPLFPVGTEELLTFLKENSNKGIITDICIDDDDYSELALFDALIVIGAFIVTSVVAPIFVNLISEYIKKRWPSKSSSSQIKVELTVVNRYGESLKISYEGPSEEYQRTLNPTLKAFSDKGKKSLKKG